MRILTNQQGKVLVGNEQAYARIGALGNCIVTKNEETMA